jgi:hypothetical protein
MSSKNRVVGSQRLRWFVPGHRPAHREQRDRVEIGEAPALNRALRVAVVGKGQAQRRRTARVVTAGKRRVKFNRFPPLWM